MEEYIESAHDCNALIVGQSGANVATTEKIINTDKSCTVLACASPVHDTRACAIYLAMTPNYLLRVVFLFVSLACFLFFFVAK